MNATLSKERLNPVTKITKPIIKKKSCNLWENTPVNTLIPVKSQQMAPFYFYRC